MVTLYKIYGVNHPWIGGVVPSICDKGLTRQEACETFQAEPIEKLVGVYTTRMPNGGYEYLGKFKVWARGNRCVFAKEESECDNRSSCV